MAKVFRPHEAKRLGLPGRTSLEIVSGDRGADKVTLRLVEIPVPAPGDPSREPHWHEDFEECIHVLAGRGSCWVDGVEHRVEAGDTILVKPGERHVTRNIGGEPLKLLCFFPVPEIAIKS